ncbi:MAG: DUF58 domain-containing protein [Opitutales bacterium]|nr:DUF58 domain-containing protein [Opitutales bacterium]
MSDSVTEMLRKVRRIEIATRKQVSDAIAGAYHSVFKGQGMDFEEAREYQPGDEIRSIDWNVTARTGKAHVKKYREERELTMMLAVDLSASGAFGSNSQTKRELEAELASVLAFSAAKNGDKVGLALFTDEIELIIPPRKGRRHILRLIREILFFKPKHSGTDIASALDGINRLLKRRAIVVLLSDFLQGPNGILPNPDLRAQDPVLKALDLTNRRHDLICINVFDGRETELPNLGTIVLEDSETGEIVELDTFSKELTDAYKNENFKRMKDFKNALARIGIDSLKIEAGKPYIVKLRKFFEERKRR